MLSYCLHWLLAWPGTCTLLTLNSGVPSHCTQFPGRAGARLGRWPRLHDLRGSQSQAAASEGLALPDPGACAAAHFPPGMPHLPHPHPGPVDTPSVSLTLLGQGKFMSCPKLPALIPNASHLPVWPLGSGCPQLQSPFLPLDLRQHPVSGPHSSLTFSISPWLCPQPQV